MTKIRFTTAAKRKLRELADSDPAAYTENYTFLAKVSSVPLNNGHISGELPEREIDQRYFMYVLPPDGPGVYMVIVTDFVEDAAALVFDVLGRDKPEDSFVDVLAEQISVHYGGLTNEHRNMG